MEVISVFRGEGGWDGGRKPSWPFPDKMTLLVFRFSSPVPNSPIKVTKKLLKQVL